MVLVESCPGDCSPGGDLSKESWSWWGVVQGIVVLVGSCPRDRGPGGELSQGIMVLVGNSLALFVWWGIVPSGELS